VFDPLHEGAPQPPASLAADRNTSVYIVQFFAPPVDACRDAIRRQHGVIYRFLWNNAYIVRLGQDGVQQLRADPLVRWIGPYLPAYRIEPSVLHDLESDRFPDRRYSIEVFSGGRAEASRFTAQIAAIGGSVKLVTAEGCRYEAQLTQKQLLEVAHWNRVCFIDRVAQSLPIGMSQAAGKSLLLSEVRTMGGADEVESEEGFRGEDVGGAVVDGDVRRNHHDFQSHPILFLGRHYGSDSHGTACFGAIFGDGSGNPGARGILPAGRSVFVCGTVNPNLCRLFRALQRPPYSALFLSCSIGEEPNLRYSTRSRDLDDAVWKSDLLICDAMGNTGGRDAEPEAWAKNIVSVGGIRHGGSLERSAHRWGSSGSIGPAEDGRVKPDLSHFYDGVLCPSAESPESYKPFGGTSQATPLTAGHFGLMYQMWAKGLFGNRVKGPSVFEARPHAATAKALMINTAYTYPFAGDAADMARCHQGWGMADIGRLYELRSRMFIVDQSTPLRNLERKSYKLRVASGTPELRATMAFTDPPAGGCSTKQLVNNLTLKITSPHGVIYYGNNGLVTGNESTPGGQEDRVNNVENVWIRRPEPGVWLVEVIADQVVMDQHRSTRAFDCDYGLVVSGVKH